ncbi:hypothetical protein B0H13DRAFT_1911431 [Mycena leptocephala]|nr:hypothetical protein B0H13DRAFT_1911431 [Mycena leptocephala]
MHVCPRLDADADVPVPHAAQLPNWPAQMLMDAPPPPAPYFMHPHFVLYAECCYASFERTNSLRSRPDRASNDVSMYPRRSPTPTRRGPPRIPSSGVATDANTEYMLSHDAGSPADWPCYRARRPPVPSRLDLAPRRDLITNAALLAVHGVRYPKHPLGPNGIPAVAFALHQAVTTAVWIEKLASDPRRIRRDFVDVLAALVKPTLRADTLLRVQFNFCRVATLSGQSLFQHNSQPEEGHREPSRVKRDERMEELELGRRMDVGPYWSRISRRGHTVNTKNNNCVSPAKETSIKNSPLEIEREYLPLRVKRRGSSRRLTGLAGRHARAKEQIEVPQCAKEKPKIEIEARTIASRK